LQPDSRFDTTTVRISGTAIDDKSVQKVEVVIRASNRHYLGDATFGSDYQTISAELTAAGEPRSEWTIEVSLRPDTYWISARAIDSDGNEDSIIPTAFFTVSEN